MSASERQHHNTAGAVLTSGSLLDSVLDSWDRNNTILTNLLRAVPAHALNVRASADSPTIVALFAHIHYVRLVFVAEDAAEYATDVPDSEWAEEIDRDGMVRLLSDSAQAVRQAVAKTLSTGGAMAMHYDHPILFLQHMIWHEGYHHGQIKLALKLAGHALNDEIAGPLTWGVWMHKSERAK